MDRSHGCGHAARLLVPVSAFLLVVGSVAVAAPAIADRSPQGQSHSASGQAHRPDKATPRAAAAAKPARSGTSAVGLPRPNDFQAQADPDGTENGGVDQPGGTGGVDTTSQDGNNGSGNDADCEDDNRGVGVPGHCKETAEEQATEVVASSTPVVPTVAAPVVRFDEPSSGVPHVSWAASQPRAQAAPPAARETSLPNTGAGKALLTLALAGLVALALGGGLVRKGRRSTA